MIDLYVSRAYNRRVATDEDYLREVFSLVTDAWCAGTLTGRIPDGGTYCVGWSTDACVAWDDDLAFGITGATPSELRN